MKEQLTKILDSFKAFWAAKDKKQKIIIWSVIGGILVLAVGLTIYLNRPQYVTLFSGMPEEEVREVVVQLDTLGVRNFVIEGGTGVSVLKGTEAKARMDLSTLGYPKSPLNYTWLEKGQGMFVTESQRKAYEKVQSQERLQASLRSLDNVDDCTVSLNIPDDRGTVLTVNQKPATASVTMRLKPDTYLTSKQISGIRRLVVTFVPGMIDDNVTIIDNHGNELLPGDSGAEDPNETLSITRNRQRFQQEIEGAISGAISDLLLGAYGPGNFSVAVNSKLNFNKEITEKTEYVPSGDDGNGMVQHVDKENYSGSGGAAEGVVGADPNAEETYPTQDGENGAVWSKNYSSTSYLVNTLREQIEKQDYTFDQLSASVVIYRDYLAQDVLAQLTDSIAKAAGVVPENVSVIALPPYNQIQPTVATPYPFGMSQTQFLLVMTVLGILIVMFVVMYLSVARKAQRKRHALEQAIYEAAQAAGDRGQVAGFFNAEGGILQDDVARLAEAQNNESKEEAVRREIGEFAHTSPEVVAQLLKGWLHDEEDHHGKK